MSATTMHTGPAGVAGRGWRTRAACASTSVDPELFYPLDPDPAGPAVTAARRVCADCPVQLACLLDVMTGEDPARRWGITAGLTADERADLHTSRRHVAARPGAVAA